MEEKDLLQDDFLRKMMGKSSLESPPDGFTERVMGMIGTEPVAVGQNKPFISYLGSILGILVLVSIVTLFFITSDISVSSWFPGKEFFTGTLLPYFQSFADSMKFLSGKGKGISIPAMIIAAAALFFLIDQVFGRGKAVGSQQSAAGS